MHNSGTPTAYSADQRVVLTLDAGGTSFRFSARRGASAVTPTLSLPTDANDLDRCLGRLVDGFTRVRAQCPAAPVAISFAFPGPADYPAGIIGDLPNLPAFRGGVALGPMLADTFGVPVFINNDGDLFAYGEAMAGLLPQVNLLLAHAGSPKRFNNLLGLTLGTGLGAGIVRRGELFHGDNSMAGEAWVLRHKLDAGLNAEEGASIRAVRRVYADLAGIAFADAPEPKVIADIADGRQSGDAAAAREAFRRLGEVAGDAAAQAITLVDGLVVVGGGLANSGDLFLPAFVAAMNDVFPKPPSGLRRLVQRAFSLEDPTEREQFIRGDRVSVAVPRTQRQVEYDRLARTGVGLSRLGTSEAIAMGAYVFALASLDAATRA